MFGRIAVIAWLVSLAVAPASSELTQPGATATLPWKFTALHHFDNVPLTLNPLMRAARSLAEYAFQDPTLVSGMAVIRAQHIQDLRAALHQAYVAANVPPPTYTDPSLTTGTVARAVHIAELRSAVTALE